MGTQTRSVKTEVPYVRPKGVIKLQYCVTSVLVRVNGNRHIPQTVSDLSENSLATIGEDWHKITEVRLCSTADSGAEII